MTVGGELIRELMRTSYRAEVLPAEEVSRQDPFGGRGMRIGVDPGASREEVIRLVERDYPGQAYVVWDQCAWIERGLGETGAGE